MENYNTLGIRIKTARQKMGLSQAELAEQLNCTQAALSQYERGTREPSVRDLISIANKLNTSTDYLLCQTDIINREIILQDISNYLGLSEESINKLHKMFLARKKRIAEENILEDLKYYSNAIPTDENYATDYAFIQRNNYQELNDYTKTLNQFICSHEFSVLISCLISNLFLERSIYDLMRIVGEQYDKVETPFANENLAEQAYSLVEDGEQNLNRYSLNLFDIQTSINNFCQNFTKLEAVKRLEYDESFYRKLCYYVYSATSSMFKKDEYPLEILEQNLSYAREKLGKQVSELLAQ